MRFILSFIGILVVQFTFAQAIDSLTADQRRQVKQAAKALYAPQSNFDFSFQSSDLEPDGRQKKNSAPASESSILFLKNKLRGTNDDAPVYFEIAQLHKRRFEYTKAADAFAKAYKLNGARVKANPKHVGYQTLQGQIFSEMGNISKALEHLGRAYLENPKDTVVRGLFPTLLILIGDFAFAEEIIQENLKNSTDSLQEYIQLSTIHFFRFFSEEHADAFRQNPDYYLQQPIDSLYDLKAFQDLSTQHPDDYRYTLLYALYKEMALLSKSYFTFDMESRKFHQSPSDKAHIKELQKFYQAGLKRKDDDFIYYNALGALSMMENDFKKAGTYFEKAIKAKPLSVCTHKDHQGPIYDNMIAAHLLNRDTTAALKTLERKISTNATIDPAPENYSLRARFYAANNDLAAAKKAAHQALSIDTNHVDAYMALAYIAVMQDDFATAGGHIDRILSRNKNDIDATLLLGVGALLENDFTTADFIFKRVMEVNPDDKLAAKLLAIYND